MENKSLVGMYNGGVTCVERRGRAPCSRKTVESIDQRSTGVGQVVQPSCSVRWLGWSHGGMAGKACWSQALEDFKCQEYLCDMGVPPGVLLDTCSGLDTARASAS